MEESDIIDRPIIGILRRVAGETLIYGLSTVLGRLLNVFLLPLYTHLLLPAEYGIVGTIFAFMAFLNVIYSYGIDFAFMRYSSIHDRQTEIETFSTALICISASSVLFSGALLYATDPVARMLGVPQRLQDSARYAAIILALDAVALVPFALLRVQRKARIFAAIKTVGIGVNLVLSYFLLVNLHLGINGVFLAGVFASAATLAMLAPIIVANFTLTFNRHLSYTLLRFGLPLVPAGIASMVVQVIDRPILTAMTNAPTVGIYLANYKLGIFMQMVVNMFDAGWRPFILSRAKDTQAKALISRMLTYFLLCGGIAYLAVSLFIPYIVAIPIAPGKTLIHPDYWSGLSIVPIVLLGYLFNGIYVNFLVPINLAQRNELIIYSTCLGAAINVTANILLIPLWGITGAALATLAAYVAMAGSLYFLAQKAYPIDYEYRRLAHLGICLALFSAAAYLPLQGLHRLAILTAMPLTLILTGFFSAEELGEFRRVVRSLITSRL